MRKIIILIAMALVAFTAGATDYTDSLHTIAPESAGSTFGGVETTTTIDTNDDGTINLTLKNWAYVQNNYALGLGTLTLKNIAVSDSTDGTKAFENTQTTSFTKGDLSTISYWGGTYLGDIPVTVKGHYTADKLYYTISADGSNSMFHTVYNAVFGDDSFPKAPSITFPITFTDSLQTIAPADAGVTFGAIETTTTIEQNADGTVNLTLKNWAYDLQGGLVGLGNLTLKNIALGDSINGLKTFENTQDATFTNGDLTGVYMWGGSYIGTVPVTVKGHFNQTKIYYTIKADASKSYFNSVYNAVFGKDNFDDAGTVDGINAIHNATAKSVDNRIFDLSGRQITTPVKGSIYIQNGKKFIAR